MICGVLVAAIALFFTTFLTMLAYWYAYGVAPINPVHIAYGVLTGGGLLATALTAILAGRRADNVRR
jgi:hypothetical protein